MPKLTPRFSKDYVRDLRRRLLAAKAEFSDKEWRGMMPRLDMLERVAP